MLGGVVDFQPLRDPKRFCGLNRLAQRGRMMGVQVVHHWCPNNNKPCGNEMIERLDVAYYYPTPYWGMGECGPVKSLLLFFDRVSTCFQSICTEGTM
jgi:hypothetical protein